MNNAKKTFISGLNHDASFFAHTKEDNLDALNARVISSSDGKSGSLSNICLLYTSPSPRDLSTSRMPSSA